MILYREFVLGTFSLERFASLNICRVKVTLVTSYWAYCLLINTSRVSACLSGCWLLLTSFGKHVLVP